MKINIKSGFKQKIALGIIFVLIFSYTVYHIISLFSEDVSFFAAGVTTEEKVISYSGYIFRDEELLTSDYTGVADYLVEDGSKVAEGQEVATVYEENGKYQDYIEQINEYIYLLEEGVASFDADIVGQRKANNDTYDSIVKLLADKSAKGLSFRANKLLIGMNKIDSIIEKENAVGPDTLAQLLEEREKIFSVSGDGETYEAESSGYFFSNVDGCEDYFTLSELEDLDHETFSALVEYAKNPEQIPEAYGKMTYSSEWRLVVEMNREDAAYFEEENTYNANLSGNSDLTVPLTLERVIDDGTKDTVFTVFLCDRHPERFSFDRCQGVSITVESVSGIYVPKNVVVKENGSRGVYILRGSVVHFRYIEILYEGSDYYIVKKDSEHKDGRYYIRENDMIILDGKNLFDGRVMD